MSGLDVTVTYLPPRLHKCFTGTAYIGASTTKEIQMSDIILKAKAAMTYADRVIAVFLLGVMLAVTPLYCSAAIIKARTHARDVPMLTPMSMKVLARAMPVKLTAVSMRLPPVLPRRHK